MGPASPRWRAWAPLLCGRICKKRFLAGFFLSKSKNEILQLCNKEDDNAWIFRVAGRCSAGGLWAFTTPPTDGASVAEFLGGGSRRLWITFWKDISAAKMCNFATFHTEIHCRSCVNGLGPMLIFEWRPLLSFFGPDTDAVGGCWENIRSGRGGPRGEEVRRPRA